MTAEETTKKTTTNRPTRQGNDAKKSASTTEEKPAEKKLVEKRVVDEVTAHLRFLRIAPRKVRLVIDPLRGKDVMATVEQLRFVNKGAAVPVMKLIRSAVANAEHNFNLDPATLVIKKIVANDGPSLKRQQPRAHGRSALILKRSSHVTVVLGVRRGGTETKKKVKPATKAEPKRT